MVKLEQVKREGDVISCIAFVEDCEIPVKITLNTAGEMTADELPEGYDWCDSHLAHAERALSEMLETGKVEPRSTIMWY